MNVWKEFILQRLTRDEVQVRTIFDNMENLELFDKDIQRFLSDKLSDYDISYKKHPCQTEKAVTGGMIFYLKEKISAFYLSLSQSTMKVSFPKL